MLSMYGVGMLVIFGLKWILLAAGGACLWAGLGPWAAAGVVLVALAVLWEVSWRCR